MQGGATTPQGSEPPELAYHSDRCETGERSARARLRRSRAQLRGRQRPRNPSGRENTCSEQGGTLNGASAVGRSSGTARGGGALHLDGDQPPKHHQHESFAACMQRSLLPKWPRWEDLSFQNLELERA